MGRSDLPWLNLIDIDKLNVMTNKILLWMSATLDSLKDLESMVIRQPFC